MAVRCAQPCRQRTRAFAAGSTSSSSRKTDLPKASSPWSLHLDFEAAAYPVDFAAAFPAPSRPPLPLTVAVLRLRPSVQVLGLVLFAAVIVAVALAHGLAERHADPGRVPRTSRPMARTRRRGAPGGADPIPSREDRAPRHRRRERGPAPKPPPGGGSPFVDMRDSTARAERPTPCACRRSSRRFSGGSCGRPRSTAASSTGSPSTERWSSSAFPSGAPTTRHARRHARERCRNASTRGTASGRSPRRCAWGPACMPRSVLRRDRRRDAPGTRRARRCRECRCAPRAGDERRRRAPARIVDCGRRDREGPGRTESRRGCRRCFAMPTPPVDDRAPADSRVTRHSTPHRAGAARPPCILWPVRSSSQYGLRVTPASKGACAHGCDRFAARTPDAPAARQLPGGCRSGVA